MAATTIFQAISRTFRHVSLVHDSFTKQDRDYHSDLLDRRFAPIVSRIFDVPPSALRANDMFIVRSDYDANSEGEFDTHIDESNITIASC
jgi:hypothetical protein